MKNHFFEDQPENQSVPRRALVAIDFSAASRSALTYAGSFVSQSGAALHLVHVLELDFPRAGISVPEGEIERRACARLKDLALRQGLIVPRKGIHVLKGKPYVEICRLARELQIDLIFVGTRGQSGLKHLALGSTAERVVRHASCPVMVLRSLGTSPAPAARFKTILVPFDFSSCAAAGLERAKSIAREFGSRLLLLHSVNLHYYSTNPEYMLYDFAPLEQAAEEAGREQLQETVAALEAEGFDASGSLEAGHPGAQICRRAAELGADLIVTSTHGHRGLKHALLGSTAEYVVRHAPCPVLVLPSGVPVARARLVAA